MIEYKVTVTDDVKKDLKRYRDYLVNVKKSPQSAKNVVLDFRETRKVLQSTAGSIKDPDSVALRTRRLKRINFLKHNYFLLFRIEGTTVFVTNMFHGLEDYENKLV